MRKGERNERYIDADKFIEELQPAINLDWNKNNHYKSKTEIIEEFYVELENAETADLQEIRHGKWIRATPHLQYYCNKCGLTPKTIFGKLPPICPQLRRKDGFEG